jgi:hypothetical protein
VIQGTRPRGLLNPHGSESSFRGRLQDVSALLQGSFPSLYEEFSHLIFVAAIPGTS